ncbi:MAG: trypsin-like peptidase domain-containing protein [Actinomycetota bacterium]|nr:trypsin-like peptidase domain-containing protein [Actinomycetota bacterium]
MTATHHSSMPTSPPPFPEPGDGPGISGPNPPTPRTPSSGGRGRGFLAGALAGALTGALVAGGLAVALDDDPAASVPTADTSATGTEGTQTNVSQPAAPDTSGSPAAADIGALVDVVGPSVVTIETEIAQVGSIFEATPQQGAGTGFVVSADGDIVTNAHVVDGADRITVTFSDGTTEPATLVAADPSNDLAVLNIDRTGLDTVTLGDSDDLEVGDQVIAIGNALGLPGGPTVTEGIVSALDRSITEPNGETIDDLIQTDTAINPGNSGGPLLNADGEVIGINTAIAGNAQNIGFAIAIDPVEDLIDQLRAGEVPAQPFLGVATQTVTPAFAERFDLGTDTGAAVAQVTPGSGAADAGLEVGDVIVGVDGDEITSSDDLGAAIDGHAPGDEITLDVIRAGEETTLSATLGERAG